MTVTKKLRGLPAKQAFDAAAAQRRQPLVIVAPHTDANGNPRPERLELITLEAMLRAIEDAQAQSPPKRGRKLDVGKLQAASRALYDAGLPLTSGTKGRGPAVIAKALGAPTDTARDIARRLAELVDGSVHRQAVASPAWRSGRKS